MELWKLVAHRHWLTLRIFDRELRLCARCSGYVAGFLTLTVLLNLFEFNLFRSLTIQSQLFICLLLVVPLASDWLTQSWGLRNSNNRLRLFTGAILGAGTALLNSTEATPYLKTWFYGGIAVIISIVGSLDISYLPKD